jgi:hypothetical protein
VIVIVAIVGVPAQLPVTLATAMWPAPVPSCGVVQPVGIASWSLLFDAKVWPPVENVKVSVWPVAPLTTSVGVTVIVPAPSAAPAAIDVARKKMTSPTNPATGAPSARRLVLVLNNI